MTFRPRVALLTREYPPEVYGGAGVHVAELARAVADHVDLDVHCFGGARDDALVAAAYEPWDALAGDAPELSALRMMSVDLAMVAGLGPGRAGAGTGTDGIDLVHSHTWYANLAGHLAKLVYGVPHVVTTHSLEPLRPWKREQLGGGYELSSFCERTGVEGADAVIAVSEGMKADVLAAYPALDADRVAVIHNGVDPETYRPDDDPAPLAANGIDGSRPYAVFVGRITRQKGVEQLLDAAWHLPAGSQLVLCAGAPDTPEIAEEFRARVAALEAAPVEVVWIERMLPPAELVPILSQARVFVCPSIYEPFGIVNLEAMACGTAVVATAVGGIPEIVVPDETGWLVSFEPDELGSPRDPDGFARDLAGRIQALLDDEDLAGAMGRAGRRRVEERFAWPAIAAATADLYRSLLP